MVSAKKAGLLDELREMLPDTPEAREVFRRICDELTPDHLLTTREAADMLGIRSVNTLKALLHAAQVPTVKVGSHTRIARREVERLRNDRRTEMLREGDRLWDLVDEAFGTEGLTQEQMDALSEARPGTLPWKRKT